MHIRKPGGPCEIGHALKADHALLETAFRHALARIHCGDWDVIHPAWLRVQADLAARLESEELLILPAFAQNHPDEAARIRHEHRAIRAALQRLDAELAARDSGSESSDAFLAALRAHAQSEESLFYRWAQTQLPGRQKQAIFVRLRSLLRARVSTPSSHAL